ncbi:MAG: hypothetical protein HY617_01060 [Candidatus Sungbacteria bacterium]|nr:hypothetical protein [Candidatus Sungbacteria bacterium]
MNLWQKHEVKLLDASTVPYRLAFDENVPTPTLDARVAAWRDAKGQPFPKRDMLPHRVGISSFYPTRLGSFSESERGVICCFPVTWAQYVLMSRGDVREALPLEEHFNVLTVNCLVRTSDDLLVLASRSKGQSHFGGMLHTSAAGYCDLNLAMETRTPLLQCLVELQEELNVLSCDVRFVKQLGLALQLPRDSAAEEVCFYAEVNLSAKEVLARATTAKDSWEGKVGAFSESEVRRMLDTEKFLPTGAATLMLLFGIE